MKARFLLVAGALFLALVFTSPAATHYVNLNSPGAISPFTNWATAATNIQQAVNAAKAGELVLVTNGVYQTGGANAPDGLMTRVSVTAASAIESVNGPSQTVIEGYQDPVTTNGSDAIRCVYLANGASLTGFTVTGGATLSPPNGFSGGTVYGGGGISCASTNVYVTNCVISNNASSLFCAGVNRGTLYNCTVVSNTTTGSSQNQSSGGAGAYTSTLVNCTVTGNNSGQGSIGTVYDSTLVNCILSSNIGNNYGGGASDSTLTGCTLTANTAWVGGGAYECILNGCILASNLADGATALGPSGGGAYGCTLTNCTLIGNSAPYLGGGGASGGTLVNCLVISNTSSHGNYGGGVYGATLNGCLIMGNTGWEFGGGANACVLNNCTVVSNSSGFCGGTYSCTQNNCIIMFNQAIYTNVYPPTIGPYSNYEGGVLNYCDTAPLPSGQGNFTANPQFTDAYHIASFSPCRGVGSAAYAIGTDLDGDPWQNPPSVGCDEYTGLTPLSVLISPNYTNTIPGLSLNFAGEFAGSVGSWVWNFGDGATATNILNVTHGWQTPGTYDVSLTADNAANPGGVSDSVNINVVVQPVHYVSQGSSSPAPPYSSWATAATNIQDAVDATSATLGELVLVSNGFYNIGGRIVPPFTLTNRLAVTNPIIVQSINGWDTTVIAGSQASNFPSTGTNAVRCVWLGDSAVLTGFTLENGATLQTAAMTNDVVGGGVWCATPSALVSNCLIISNAAMFGGGAHGNLIDCVIVGNYGLYPGPYIFPGSPISGGGAWFSVLDDCVITGNVAPAAGGGVAGCTLYNCTVANNSANFAGGTLFCTNYNSTIYSNQPSDDFDSLFRSSCTSVQESGPGNITNNPLFVNAANGNFRLQSNSPCINAGNNAYVTTATDLDGNPRISGGTVDIGAYEFQNPASIISYAWLEQCGLPTDGTADFADTDGNGMNNWQKWIAGLNPTNPASILQMMPPATSGSNIVVTWQSVTNINYFLERSLGINPPLFQTIATNIPGQSGTTSYTDTNAPAPGPWFYQVGVP